MKFCQWMVVGVMFGGLSIGLAVGNAEPATWPSAPTTEPADHSQRRLGVTIEDLHKRDDGKALIDDLGGHLVVSVVARGSIAEKMGIRAVDVITSMNGKKLDTVDDVLRQIHGPGLLQVEIMRNGKAMELTETADMESH